eukprot:TRINITY_DN2457_c0_g1_i1.p1 TRINITY_DN2457_c0_g1~~TRINITY_DN2457_c0_g1_i1.p1  ORF type:complete len:439 (-),score=44.34 TRINITY_DN2457_c0_g1_i1:5425-6741(-)
MGFSKVTPKQIQQAFNSVPNLKKFGATMETRDLRVFYSNLKCVHLEKHVLFLVNNYFLKDKPVKTPFQFCGVIFVAEGIISVIKEKKRKAYEKGSIIGAKQFLQQQKYSSMRILPLTTATFFVLEDSTFKEIVNTSPAAAIGILKAILHTQPNIQFSSEKNHCEFIYGHKTTEIEEKMFEEFSKKKREESPEVEKGQKAKKPENVNIYKSQFLNTKISEQMEEMRLKKLEQKRLSRKGVTLAITPDVPKPEKVLKAANINVEDIGNLRNYIQTLKKEMDKMSADIEKLEAEKQTMEAVYKNERNEREKLEIELKKTCLLREIESTQAEKRKREKENQNLRTTYRTLSFGQIVSCWHLILINRQRNNTVHQAYYTRQPSAFISGTTILRRKCSVSLRQTNSRLDYFLINQMFCISASMQHHACMQTRIEGSIKSDNQFL